MKRWFLSVTLLFSTSMVSAVHAQTSNAGMMTVPAGTVIGCAEHQMCGLTCFLMPTFLASCRQICRTTEGCMGEPGFSLGNNQSGGLRHASRHLTRNEANTGLGAR